MSDDWLDVQEFSKLVGCSVARLRILVRCGLLTPWSPYLKYSPAEPIAAVPQLVVLAGNGAEVITFSKELLTDSRFLMLATNSVNPEKWGPGWNGPRDAKLVGFLDPKRVRVLEPGKRSLRICAVSVVFLHIRIGDTWGYSNARARLSGWVGGCGCLSCGGAVCPGAPDFRSKLFSCI